MLKYKVRIQPTISHSYIYDYFRRDVGLMLDDSKIKEALKETREKVEGSEKEQYGLIWDYTHELMSTNPGLTWTDHPRLRYQVQNGSIKVDVDSDVIMCACRYWHLSNKPRSFCYDLMLWLRSYELWRGLYVMI